MHQCAHRQTEGHGVSAAAAARACVAGVGPSAGANGSLQESELVGYEVNNSQAYREHTEA